MEPSHNAGEETTRWRLRAPPHPWRTWSRPYGDSIGSRPIDLIIRDKSIEVSYVGRPAVESVVSSISLIRYVR